MIMDASAQRQTRQKRESFAGFVRKEWREKSETEPRDAFHILHRRSEEGLFLHIGATKHTCVSQAMILFALSKGPLNGLLTPGIELFACRRFREGVYVV